VLIIKENGKVRLQNRHGANYSWRLTEFVDAAQRLKGDFVLDGEACFVNPTTGQVQFTECQRRCATQDAGAQIYLRQKYPLVFKAFDIIMYNGTDLTSLPYMERKMLLSKVAPLSGTIEYVPFRTDIKRFFEEVKARGDEGIIIKRVDSRYEHERSFNWLKIKNWRDEECAVVGYTPGKNARTPFFGALVLADKDGNYRGCVGSGFNDWDLRQIKDLLSDAPKVSPPFDIGEPYTAVKTSMKVEVKHYKATDAGVLRFPVFRRITP
jgi:ATP-dependent DNA ligase